MVEENTKKSVQVVEKVNSSGEPDRAVWGNHFEYFLSSLGLAVGLGNLWRFPYVCYQYGGGTFILCYLFMLLLVGLPIFFMEMVFGQYAGLSATKIYGRLAPGLRGMGMGVVTIPTIVNFYYTVIMAYAFYFLFMGFTANEKLPWGLCDHDYNTPNCYSLVNAARCGNKTVFYNNTCTEIVDFCNTFGYDYEDDYTHCYNEDEPPVAIRDVTFRVAASEEFWYKQVLGMHVEFSENKTKIITEKTSWTTWGNVNWKIAGCLLCVGYWFACL